MRCAKCGAEWTTNINNKISNCPFCGELLMGNIPYQQVLDAIGMIIERFGVEIYGEEKRFYALLTDILPNTSKEKNILKTVIFLGASKLIMELVSEHSNKEEVLRKCYDLLASGGLSNLWCASALYMISMPLGIDPTDIYPLDEEHNIEGFDIAAITTTYDEQLDKTYSEKTVDELINMVVCGDVVASTELGERYYSGIGTEKDIDTAIAYFIKAADAGYPIAEFILGKLYDEGQYVEHDSHRAMEYYQKAADKGYPQAQYALGQMYYLGQDCEKSDTEALYWILKAAEKLEAPDIYIVLAMIYKDSSDDEIRNEDKAFEYAEKAADMGEENAYNLLGTFYELGCGVQQNYEKAIQYYELAAENGVEIAYLNIGAFYQAGIGVPRDEQKAVEYFQYGANSGNMYCLNALGMCYKNGTGVSQDYEKAFELFLNAAYAGNFAGEVNVGLAYDEGQGTPEDKVEAKKWFTLAAGHGSSKAMAILGVYKERGIPDGKIDLQEAFNWYLKAAEVGDHALAEWIVGNCYSQGLMGVEVDRCTAFEWYTKAAELGHATAQNNIACDYIKGEIIDLDYQLAVDWFEKAVQQEDMYALNNYGTLMLNGNGIPRDVDRAFKMIKRSAELGYPDAQCNLGICYFEGWGTSRDLDEALKWLLISHNAGVLAALEYLERGFKEKNGTWVKRGLFGRVPEPKKLPPITERIKCEGGCSDICKYANMTETEFLYNTEKFCYCELVGEKVFNKTKCPYYENGLDDILKLMI